MQVTTNVLRPEDVGEHGYIIGEYEAKFSNVTLRILLIRCTERYTKFSTNLVILFPEGLIHPDHALSPNFEKLFT